MINETLAGFTKLARTRSIFVPSQDLHLTTGLYSAPEGLKAAVSKVLSATWRPPRPLHEKRAGPAGNDLA